MSRVEQYEAIRRDHRLEGLGIRALAAKHRVHRRVVRQALSSAVPPPRKRAERASPQLEEFKPIIREWLTDDLLVPKKQRHTARRVFQRLRDEHDSTAAESTVRTYVQLVRADLGTLVAAVAVPQVHGLGEEAEVDFGEFWVWLGGVWTKAWMFVMRLSGSGKAFHWACTNQSLEAFLEGHVRAFALFGGVPGRIRYDNLKAAVTKVLLGRDRDLNPRFVLLRSHYGFDSFFCLPGIGGAHEKGGVEGEIGRFRRRHLVPVPQVAGLDELNDLIAAGDAGDDGRRVAARDLTIGEHFALERPHLQALSIDPFDCAHHLKVRVDTKARVCVRQCLYSVPVRLAGRRLRARLTATRVEVLDPAGTVVARHERSAHRGSETYVLDHYLEVLAHKPGALAGSKPLAQTRAAGGFTRAHQQFWDQCRVAHGDQAGTRALIEVLLAYRSLPIAAMNAAIHSAMAAGICDADAVIIEARRFADDCCVPQPVRSVGALARFDRPAPSLAAYDELLVGKAG